MKRILATFLLAGGCLTTPAFAQPARIDYSQPQAAWVDRNGAPSRETDYNGRVRGDNRAGGSDVQLAQRNGDRSYPNPNRRVWRDTRPGATWNQGTHNGYYNRNNQWRYGSPSNWQRQQRGFTMGYRPWTRGQRLGEYNQRFGEVDYRSRNLRAPPRGYRWVEDDRGDYLLAAIVGGLIAQVIINSPR